MLYLAYLGESKQLNINTEALKLLIVRKPVSGIPKGFIHVPQLSPSLPLFEQAQKWKKEITRKADIEYLKSIKKSVYEGDSWWFLYEREFKKEMKERPDMVRAIQRLIEQLNQGKDIYVFCYCKNVCRCHRGLLGKYIRDLGLLVDFRVKVIEVEEKSPITQLSLFD